MTARLYAVLVLASIPSARAACKASDTDFDKAWEKSAVVEEYRKLPVYGTVTPIWDGDSVMYYTQVRDDSTYCYRVELTGLNAGTRTPVPSDSADAAGMRRPSGFSGGWGGPGPGTFPGGMRAFNGRGETANSPDRKWECYIREFNVWIRNVESGQRTQLSFDGSPEWPYTDYSWSPDSKKIIGVRVQKHSPRQILLRDSRPDDRVQPIIRWVDYDKPGDDIAQTTLGLFSTESLSQVQFDFTPWMNQYAITEWRWAANSEYFTFEYNQRGHQTYQLVAVQADGTTRVVINEHSDTFISWDNIYRRFLPDGRLLWTSERDDWRHLYLVDPASGKSIQLTHGEWNVREFVDWDLEEGVLWFYANGLPTIPGEDPYNKHLIRIALDGSGIRDLTPTNGFHEVKMNPSHTVFTDTWSRPDLPYESVLRSSADGSVICELAKSDISRLLKAGWTRPEVFSAKGRDGVTDIWGTIYRPSDFNPSKKYPVVEYIYAGPHDSHVDKVFRPVMRFSRLVEMGFIVVTIDGMGTDNRSKSFQDVCYRNLKDAGFPDRELWIRAAQKKYRYMDTSRMGIYGYSAGGQNSLSALLFFGDFYKVAVALCGCHDNRMDKLWWNEQWMGYPVGPWYAENSNVDNAWRLEGKLFLINGEMDDNVDPASTLQVVDALVKAGKDFDQLYLPGHSHDMGSEYITRRVFRYFYENCKSTN